MVHPIKIPWNHYKIPLKHYKIPLNHYTIPFNHYTIPLNHDKITLNHYKIPSLQKQLYILRITSHPQLRGLPKILWARSAVALPPAVRRGWWTHQRAARPPSSRTTPPGIAKRQRMARAGDKFCELHGFHGISKWIHGKLWDFRMISWIWMVIWLLISLW